MLKKLGALAAPVLTFFAGCNPTAAAKRDMLLVYAAGAQQAEGQVRIAPQTYLDVWSEASDSKKIYTSSLLKATSADEAVVRGLVKDGIARLTAAKAGQAVVTFEGIINPGEQQASQRLTIVVAEPAKVTFGAPRAGEVYLVGQPIHVTLAVADASGAAIAGVGPAPVTLEGAGKLAPEASWSSHLVIEAPREAGELTLRSTVDSATLTVKVVALSALRGIKLDGARTLKVGEREGFELMATTEADEHVRAPLDYTVENLTPALCDAEVERVEADGLLTGGAMLQVDAKAAGACKLKVTAGALATEVTIVVE